MKDVSLNGIKDGARCRVVAGTHKGKAGVVRDIKTSKTGSISLRR